MVFGDMRCQCSCKELLLSDVIGGVELFRLFKIVCDSEEIVSLTTSFDDFMI